MSFMAVFSSKGGLSSEKSKSVASAIYQSCHSVVYFPLETKMQQQRVRVGDMILLCCQELPSSAL